MNLLAVERIKLFSTRSPWWCIGAALAVTIGLATLLVVASERVVVESTQFGYQFGLMVILVMAALAITTEYRFSTIRATFQAVPNRTKALLAKATVVAGVALVVGEVAAFGSLGMSALLSPASDLALTNADQWRVVAGTGPVFMIASVLALAVGILVRHTAGAVTLLLIWSLLLEDMVRFIPEVGDDLHPWLPFTAAAEFLTMSSGPQQTQLAFGPWGALGYFAALTAGLFAVALVVANRRDA